MKNTLEQINGNMIAHFEPFQGIGEFKIGANIAPYMKKFALEFTPADSSTGWDTYELEHPEISISTEENVIVSIACYDECLYKGRNMIGMTIEEFLNYYELKSDGEADELLFEEGDVEPQFVYEFDSIGLQVWVKKDHILNVIASGYIEE